MSNPHTGQQLVGSEEQVNGFRFIKIIGRDIAGRFVFKAINYKHQKRAVKIISLIPMQVMDIAFDEAILVTDLSHPNIIQSYEFMVRKQNTQLLIFTQHCQDCLAKSYKQIPDTQLVKCAYGIIEGLQYIHETANTSHNDIRMESIQLYGKNRIPKLSFYSIDTQNKQIDHQTYSSRELHRQYEQKKRFNQLYSSKADDMWALGYLLLELFSKKRINQIIHQSSRLNPDAPRDITPSNKAIYQQLKFTKIRQLVRKLFNPNPAQRPTISQFKQDFRSAVQSNDFSITKPIRDYGQLRQQRVMVNKIPQKKRSQQKYQQIIQRTSRKTNADAFRLDGATDKTKLKILNLSQMKITRIQPVYGVPNLEWLYLEGNMIRKIQNLDYARLKGLNLGNNLISKIQGLDRLTSLQELYLQSNEISKIQNLEQLRNLKWLYLNHNKIIFIQNLNQLKALKTIALRENPIDQFRDVNAEALRQLKKQGIQVYLQ